MTSFPMHEAFLVGGFIGVALWGLFSVLFAYTIIRIISDSNLKRNVVLITAVIVMYLLSTAHIFVQVTRIITAFVYHSEPVGPIPGPMAFLLDPNNPLDIATNALMVTLTCIGDSVVAWRCYVVWKANKLILIPAALLVIGTACTGYASVATGGDLHVSKTVTNGLGTGMFAMSLSTNIVIAALTAGRIWFVQKVYGSQRASTDRTRYGTIITLIVESGAVLVVVELLEIIIFEIAIGETTRVSGVIFIFFASLPQLLGIVPTLIVAFVISKAAIPSSPSDAEQGQPWSKPSSQGAQFTTVVASQVSRSDSDEVTLYGHERKISAWSARGVGMEAGSEQGHPSEASHSGQQRRDTLIR